MKNNLTTYKSNGALNNGRSVFRFKSDRLIFFICILIAAVFWLLIKLSVVYTIENSFRLTYNNEPSGMRITQLVDTTLDLNLTARGFAILKLKLFNDMENLDINLGSYSIESKGDNRYAIYTQELTKKLAQIVNVSEKNIQFSKAMLTFEMEKTSEKLVAIVPNYSLNFISQYDLYETVTSDPASVIIYGPQSVLDKIDNISTNKLVLDNVMSNQLVKVGLENPLSDLIRLSVPDVELDFKVEKFTESEIIVPINHSKLQYNIKTFPSQVKVFFRVAQIDFNDVRSHQFSISPTLNNMDILHANKLPLKLIKQPEFVRNIRIVPPDVEFLIIK
ncbi:MAG: hypothetical protein QM503_08270 [Bacteroidota bacterium]